MEKKLRAILIKILGVEHYLWLVSTCYILLVKCGFFKKRYAELFFLKKIIKSGYIVIDIGANVGYYTSLMSVYCGANGRVYAVEPVAVFERVLKKNTKVFGRNNVRFLPYALGGESKTIQMETPVIDGVFRHGLTHISDQQDEANTHHSKVFVSQMKTPNELFGHLEKIDFIKCDVEGYETHIFPHFKEILRKHKPMIQMEISSEKNRKEMIEMLGGLGYKVQVLKEGVLMDCEYSKAIGYERDDFYFTI
jgi:FkbM family methyltransferase